MNLLSEVGDLVHAYNKWLKDKTIVRQEIEDTIEVTTPFLDRHNDYIQIYITRKGDDFQISDGGATVDDLKLDGIEINTPKRKELFQLCINGFGVEFDAGRIVASANKETFSLRKHSLVQAVLAVNDLFYLHSSSVLTLFKEDVEQWLIENNVRFLRDISVSGKSGYPFLFDFAIPRSASRGDRLVKTVTNSTPNNIKNVAFAWNDVRTHRHKNTEAIAIINDASKFDTRSIDALYEYDVRPIRWSQINDSKDIFAS